MILPITTVMRKLQNERTYVTVIRVRFMDQARLDYQVEELKRFLRQRHRIPEGEPEDFMIYSPKEIITFLVALTGSLVLFLGFPVSYPSLWPVSCWPIFFCFP
jgi:putative ABC transport system permease protein